MGAIGVDIPAGADYIYRLNFFAGFIVASGSYYLLSRFFPIPATSKVWLEVGDEIRNPSVAYGADDVESVTGSDADKGGRVKEMAF